MTGNRGLLNMKQLLTSKTILKRFLLWIISNFAAESNRQCCKNTYISVRCKHGAFHSSMSETMKKKIT